MTYSCIIIATITTAIISLTTINYKTLIYFILLGNERLPDLFLMLLYYSNNIIVYDIFV